MLLNLVLIDQIPLPCHTTRWGRAAVPLLTAPQHILAWGGCSSVAELRVCISEPPARWTSLTHQRNLPTLSGKSQLFATFNLVNRNRSRRRAPPIIFLRDPVIDVPPAPLPLAAGPGSITKRAACPIVSRPIPFDPIPFLSIPSRSTPHCPSPSLAQCACSTCDATGQARPCTAPRFISRVIREKCGCPARGGSP